MMESDLYPAVKRFLGARGYDVKGEIAGCDVVGVKGEVAGCDVVGVRPGTLGMACGTGPATVMVAELKLGFTLELVLQGIDRMAGADEVWLAVPATRRGRDRDARVRKLCRLLGFGLLAVGGGQSNSGNGIEVLVEPAPYRPRGDARRRRALVAEHGRRVGDPSPGGTGGLPIMTAYRQEALACAARLRDGPQPTQAMAEASPRATAILYRNVYGWFDRVGRGTYALNPAGRAALSAFAGP